MKSRLRLTYERFLAYFGNKITRKERHAFEKSVMQDDFESDAFDGLAKLNAMEMQQDLKELNRNLQSKIKSKQKKGVMWLPYAASVVVIIGLSFVLFYINQSSRVNEFVSQDIEQIVSKNELENIPVTKQDSLEIQADRPEQERDEVEFLDEEVVESEEMEIMLVEDDQEIEALEEMESMELKQKRPVVAKVLVENEEKSFEILSKKVQKTISGKVAEGPADSQVRVRDVTSLTKSSPKMYKHIKGKVVDANQDPLPGVSVVVKGTTRGVTTDMDGNFKMSLIDTNTDYKLTASFVGFEPKEIDVADSLLVVLEQDATELSEVVITAYGAKSKKAYETGSESEIETEKSIKSWNKAQPSVSKNISDYKNKLISALQLEFGNKLQGKYKVKVSFKVLSSGNISEIQLKGNKNNELSEKIKELIQNGESWIPAKNNESSIESKVRFTLIIEF